MQLVCPAGSLPALKAAVRQGADAVYVGFKDDTNARHFAGLNFSEKQLEQGLALIRQQQKSSISRLIPMLNPVLGRAGNERSIKRPHWGWMP